MITIRNFFVVRKEYIIIKNNNKKKLFNFIFAVIFTFILIYIFRLIFGVQSPVIFFNFFIFNNMHKLF